MKNDGWAKWGRTPVKMQAVSSCREGRAGWKEEGAKNEPGECSLGWEAWLIIPAPRVPGHGRMDT